MVVKQGEDNVFTLWFEEITEQLACYQYHEIGHFWVQGMEQWRQLVYMIGTIYDKYEYLGEEVCTEKELELIPLMGVRSFSRLVTCWKFPGRLVYRHHYRGRNHEENGSSDRGGRICKIAGQV